MTDECASAAPRVRVKLTFGAATMGPGKARLLRDIARLGSISAAAKAMGINYRRAWFLIETLNAAAGRPVVETSKGGSGGGGATLTETGQALLEAFERIVDAAEAASGPALADLAGRLERPGD